MSCGDFRRSTSAFSSRISWNAISSTCSRFICDFSEEFESFIGFVCILKLLGGAFLKLFTKVVKFVEDFCLSIQVSIVVFHDSTIQVKIFWAIFLYMGDP